MLDAVRLTSGPGRGNVSASAIGSVLGIARIRAVSDALERAVAEGYVRSVPVFRCTDCGTVDPKHGIGPVRCPYCSRDTLRTEFTLYQATQALLQRSPDSPVRSGVAAGFAPDHLTDMDRTVPPEADRGGAATAARATAFSTARTARDWAPRAGIGVAVAAAAVATWIALHPAGTPSPPVSTPPPGSTSASRPVGAGVLYASEAEARAKCGAQRVVFANAHSRIWHLQGDRYYGIWNRTPFPRKVTAAPTTSTGPDTASRALRNRVPPPCHARFSA